jgi:Flp pilus assembly protein TadG
VFALQRTANSNKVGNKEQKMKKNGSHLVASRGERGQALVLIILVLVILLGFVALAVDSSLLFFDRRASQNAADASALSAAYAKCEGENILDAAVQVAETNGYKTNGTNTFVTVNNGPVSGPYSGNKDYIEVIITTVREPIFAGFVTTEPLTSTVRSVGYCHLGTGGGSGQPAVPGEVSLLALNKTTNGAIVNTGAAKVLVDGGIFVNSTGASAYQQDGSATTQMNWIRIRGGAELGGAFGINLAGTSEAAKLIEIVGNLTTSGAGKAVSGPFRVGGNVKNGNSVSLNGGPMEFGGNLINDGAGIINVGSSSFLVVGDVTNGASGHITAGNMVAGGGIVGSGAGTINGAVSVKGNTNLSGSAVINGNVTMEGSLTTSGTGRINGNITKAPVTKPNVSVVIPEMQDPLATILNPPAGPTGTCKSVSFPSWGTFNPALVSGSYYCNFNVGGSVTSTIPPGTYWVDSFDLSGAARLKMDGVHLYITGKNGGTAFNMGGSTSISMKETMLYLKNGAFSINGASGTLDWSAPTTGEYKGLALFMDRSNSSMASQTGSTSVAAQSGTWYAPASKCSYTGATNTVVRSQFICDTIRVTGSSNLTIKYDSTLVYQVPVPMSQPQVSLAE